MEWRAFLGRVLCDNNFCRHISRFMGDEHIAILCVLSEEFVVDVPVFLRYLNSHWSQQYGSDSKSTRAARVHSASRQTRVSGRYLPVATLNLWITSCHSPCSLIAFDCLSGLAGRADSRYVSAFWKCYISLSTGLIQHWALFSEQSKVYTVVKNFRNLE